MFVYLKYSTFVIVLCLVGGSQEVISSERHREKEYLLPKQTFRNIENKENKIHGNTISEEPRKSTSEKLGNRIDLVIKAFEGYEDLSTDAQKDLRDTWEAEVKKLDAEVVDFRIKICWIPHTIATTKPPEEFTITGESQQNLRRIINLYPQKDKSCVVF